MSINRTWKRIYDLGPSPNPNWRVQMLCDGQIHNDRRIVVLSSIVKISNNTTTPLIILTIDSVDLTKHKKIARVDINEEYNIPLDLLYAHANSPVFLTVEEYEEMRNSLFSIMICCLDMKTMKLSRISSRLIGKKNIQQNEN